ncbi:MAG: ATP-binding protein [Bdellovibrio sp.]
MFTAVVKSTSFKIFLLAIIYFITGKMGLLLALPPGYASPLWPPTGIGITALLLFGTKLWPGLILGAFFVNFSHAPEKIGILVAVLISFGNTLSILIAAKTIKKLLNFPRSFYFEKDIFLFLLIAGPMAGFISASMGVTTLFFLREIHSSNVTLNWLNWFMGDAIGGIIFGPLALIFSGPSRKYWLKSITNVLLPLVLFFSLVILAVNYFNRTEKQKLSTEFTKRAEFAFEIFEKDISSLKSRLVTLQSFYESSEEVTQQEFNHFAQTLHVNRPEIQAIAWIPIDHNKKNFFPIRFVSPQVGNDHLVGFNFGAIDKNRNLILEALDNHNIVTSGIMSLADFKQPGSGIYLLLALARPQGVLLEVTKVDRILDTINSFINDSSYRIFIEDVTYSNSTTIIDTWKKAHGEFTQKHFNPELQWNKGINVGNRNWRFYLQQDLAYSQGATSRTIMSVLATLAVTFLTCALLLIVTSRIIRTENLVEQKTLHLRELNYQLEKASKAKSEFLANMSHEIRTPLNVLIGVSDLLEESPLNDEQKHYLSISKKAGQNLLNIVDDILDISKIESGSITLEKTDVDLDEIIKDVYEMFKIKAEEKNLNLSVDFESTIKKTYSGDPTRIKQILSNLVSNAVKFTSQGQIVIKVTPNTDKKRPGNILFSVSDTGPGIPENKISQLFQPFTQADSSITRKFGGTGLGLSICKRLTNMMNGDIQVKSELNKGSVFSFTLDLPVKEDVKPSNTNMVFTERNVSRQNTGLKILMVDDSSDNRLLLKAYLKDTPHTIYEATNGVEAIEQNLDKHPDLIMMDMQMPVMDGFTAVQEIRKWEKENNLAPVTIWALTAYAMTNEIQKSLQAGCNLHLVKPIHRVDLLNHINALTNH